MKHWALALFLNVAGIIVPAAHSKLYRRVNAQFQNGIQLSLLSAANANLTRKTGSSGSRVEGARCRSTVMVACRACWSVILNVLGVAQVNRQQMQHTYTALCACFFVTLFVQGYICYIESLYCQFRYGTATPSSVSPSYRVFSCAGQTRIWLYSVCS